MWGMGAKMLVWDEKLFKVFLEYFDWSNLTISKEDDSHSDSDDQSVTGDTAVQPVPIAADDQFDHDLWVKPPAQYKLQSSEVSTVRKAMGDIKKVSMSWKDQAIRESAEFKYIWENILAKQEPRAQWYADNGTKIKGGAKTMALAQLKKYLKKW